MQTAAIIVWSYGALVLAGGVMGWVKARSKPSLIAGVAFGAALIAAGWCPYARWVGASLAAALGVIMGVRFGQTRKFMPAGLTFVLSVVALAALLVFQ
jgi:uncharacterized membrane protein (UPF0136 family)